MTNSANMKIGKASLDSSLDQKQRGLIFAILFGGVSFLVASGHQVQARTHQDVVLGGVDLTPWCRKQYGKGFKAKLIAKTAGDWTCERSAGDRRPILVVKACILQYGSRAYKAKALNWNDPYSWKCFGKKKARPTPVGCNPGPAQVAFFQHTYYKGICSVLGIGQYPNSRALRMPNDSISSIKVGSAVRVTVCKHVAKGHVTNYFFKNPQKCQTLQESIVSLRGNRVGNDSISSAKVSPRIFPR